MATTVVRAASTNVHKWNLTTRRALGVSSLPLSLSTWGTKEKKKCICCRCLFLNIHNKFSSSSHAQAEAQVSQLESGQQKQMLPPGYTQDTTFYLACSGTAHCIVQLKCNGCWAAPWTLYINRIWQPGSNASPAPCLASSFLAFFFCSDLLPAF